MEIIENLIPQESLTELTNLITHRDFNWLCDTITADTKKEQFTHPVFYDGFILSHYYTQFREHFVNHLPNYFQLIKLKVNKNPNSIDKTEHWHNDYDEIPNHNITTGVFYLNTNNGGTLFADKKFVNSEKNKIVLFDSRIKHTGVNCTDEESRIVINVNYIKN